LNLLPVAVGNDIGLTAAHRAVAIVIDSFGSVLPFVVLMAAVFATSDFCLGRGLDQSSEPSAGAQKNPGDEEGKKPLDGAMLDHFAHFLLV